MTTTTNIHGVVSVEVERIQFPTFHSLQFRFITDTGEPIEVSAFSAAPLALSDAPSKLASGEIAIEVTA